ncbi:MAG: DEAD/DEAH box helicase, partial [Acetobacteraceae bacterium]
MGTLPEPFAAWFVARGWTPRPHQLALLRAAEAKQSALLVAPTGGGKTLAGFLPSLIDLTRNPRPSGPGALHTLYVSPLKALAVDIARNLMAPVEEMGLPIRIETRTGDTPQNRRARQKDDPPHILLTTPESLELLLSQPEAGDFFAGLGAVVVDEIHALAGSKRGDQLALGLSRLATLAPAARRVGLSATVAWPEPLRAFLSPSGRAEDVRLVQVKGGAPPELSITLPEGRLPWGG